MIPKINTRSLNGDINATSTSILKDFSKRDFSADHFMKIQIRKLSVNNKLMTQALNEKAANSILAPIDEKRDGLLRVIFLEVKARELCPDAAISKDVSSTSMVLKPLSWLTPPKALISTPCCWTLKSRKWKKLLPSYQT